MHLYAEQHYATPSSTPHDRKLRWFGLLDTIALSDIVQTGVQGIVTALHDLPYGEVWSRVAITKRKDLNAKAPANLYWNAVESLPVHEDIKRGNGELDKLSPILPPKVCP
ncbi:MAG: mannonate dehydratase [Pseudoruegeria sp.]